MKQSIKRLSVVVGLLVLSVFFTNEALAVGSINNLAVGLNSSNFTNTSELVQSNGTVSRLFTLKYKLTAVNGDVYVPTSCVTNPSFNSTNNQYGVVYSLKNTSNKFVFDTKCELSSNSAVSNSLYKIKKGESKDFTLKVTVSKVRSNETMWVAVAIDSINWGSDATFSLRSPNLSAPNKNFPVNFLSVSLPTPNFIKIPLSIEFKTTPTVNFRDKFDFSWTVTGSLFGYCVATGDKVKAEQAQGGIPLDLVNLVLPTPSFWTNIKPLPSSGRVRLEARDVDKSYSVNPLKVGLDCYDVFGGKVSKSIDIKVESGTNTPSITYINGFAPTETFLDKPASTINASDTGVTLSSYSTGAIDRCSLAISNNNGEGGAPLVRSVSKTFTNTRFTFPAGNTSGAYKLVLSCFDNSNKKSEAVAYLKINNLEEIYNIHVTDLTGPTSVWSHNVNKRITWSTKNFSAGAKVDLFLCNDQLHINKCWPVKENADYRVPNTSGGSEYIRMFSRDKIKDSNYYVKIRKVANQSIVGVTDFKFTTGDIEPTLYSTPNSGSISTPVIPSPTRTSPPIEVSGTPDVWEHRVTYNIKWNKDRINSTKVDILLCNDDPGISKCWPMNSYSALNTDNDGEQSLAVWAVDKKYSTEYYLKIRKASDGRFYIISPKFTTGSDKVAVDPLNNLASVLIGFQDVMEKLWGLVN